MNKADINFLIKHLSFAVYFCLTSLAQASVPADTEDEETELLDLLNEETLIATRTRLNADFVPGMVTVLHGDELQKKGIDNVWRALGTIPGMESTLDKIGSRIIIVRGIGGTFASGNLKIMVNDVAMNSSLSGLSQPVMNMPIEQIERIEVIRGPGSAIHGEFAYAGVVNIITHKNKKSIFSGVAEHDSGLIGGLWNWNNEPQHFHASLNLATTKTDGADVRQGQDALYQSRAIGIPPNQSSRSYAPGPADEDREYYSMLLNLDYQDTSLNIQWIKDNNGGQFGALNILPPPDESDKYQNEFKTLELKQAFNISNTINSDVKLGWMEYSNDFDFTMFPPGNNPFFPFPDGLISKGYYDEEKYYTGANLFWRASTEHSFLIAVDYSHTEIKDAGQQSIGDPGFLPITIPDYWPEENQRREITSVTLQDEIHPVDKLSITLGVRYDHYSDIGDNASPRLAAVYQLSERHIFKGQYAQAFRPPTFFEMVNNPDIDPETIDTYDIEYIYKGVKTGFKSTAFYSKLDKLILENAPFGFKNSKQASIIGIEFELDHKFNYQFNIDANLSYTNPRDDSNNRSIPGTTNWLSNLTLNYQPVHYLDFSATYQYVGAKYREKEEPKNDPRDKLNAYGVVNLSATIADLAGKGTTIQLGVNNLFNEDVRYPAPMTTDDPNHLISNNYYFPSYQDDYKRPKSWWWLKFQYDF